MGPSRKRPRTEPPSAETPSNAPQAEGKTAPPAAPATDESSRTTKAEGDTSTPSKDAKLEVGSSQEVRPSSSWYGTWPRKSIPSTHVAKETILADKQSPGPPTTDLGPLSPKRVSVTRDGRPPSMNIGKSKETSDVTMGGTLEEEGVTDKKPKTPLSSSAGEEAKSEVPTKAEDIPSQAPSQQKPDAAERPATSSGWLGGWLGRQNAKPSGTPDASSSAPKTSEEPLVGEAAKVQPEPVAAPITDDSSKDNRTSTSSSWFGLWATAAPSTAAQAPTEQIPVKVDGNDTDTVMKDTPDKPPVQPAAGSSWAFWSADTSKKTAKPPEESKDIGQLAVAGEASESQPEPAEVPTVKKDTRAKSNKRGRPLSTEINEAPQNAAQSEAPSSKGTPSQSPAPTKVPPPNLLLPSVKSTYSLMENPSILQQLARLLLHAQQKPVKHVFLAKEPPKIKKALAIGIHGLFPAALLRTVIGQPTGTSIKFANYAAAAIRRWGDQHGCVDCEIEKVALEGEGKIAERVDNLWKLLLNWIDHIRKADFIMIACHSQGVPVALMLVAKLVEFGVVSTTRIAICAMAGVSLGPFAEYRSRFTMFSPASSATELFEFAEPGSVVSKKYEDSLRVAIKYGVRITYCGSIDDQLVSMESSTFSPISHPYIYRAVFVDGRIHAPNFISHLIGFALKLRNLGVSDHGLIRELSAPLAGSLYTGEGHSRLYDDERVYDLAIEFALETTPVGDVPLDVKEYQVPTNGNPYVLPWIMRGLLEEDFVKTELDTEVTELLKQFDEWKPTTKVLKDVKYRLEAVRSKL